MFDIIVHNEMYLTLVNIKMDGNQIGILKH